MAHFKLKLEINMPSYDLGQGFWKTIAEKAETIDKMGGKYTQVINDPDYDEIGTIEIESVKE